MIEDGIGRRLVPFVLQNLFCHIPAIHWHVFKSKYLRSSAVTVRLWGLVYPYLLYLRARNLERRVEELDGRFKILQRVFRRA